MIIYYNAAGETREIDDGLYAAWVAAGNPKAAEWTLQPVSPAYDQRTQQITWNGSAWIVGPIPPKATPDSVPAHKWRMALRAGGLRAAYETHVTGASANAQDYWKTAPYINRRSKFMGALRAALGITQRQLDAVFEAADTEED